MNKLPKQRMIYSNYDLSSITDEEIREMWLENETYTEEEIEELSDEAYWDERYFLDECDWDDAKELLNRVFNNAYKLLVFGSVGRWNGVFSGGFVCDTLDEVLNIAQRIVIISSFTMKTDTYIYIVHTTTVHVVLKLKPLQNRVMIILIIGNTIGTTSVLRLYL